MSPTAKHNLMSAVLFLAVVEGCDCRRGPGQGNGVVPNDGQPSTVAVLDFGNVPVGQHARLPLQLGDVGAGILDITNQTIANDTTSAFSEPVALAASIAASASSTASVQFTPTQSGPASAVLNITDDGLPTLVPVQLKGVGVDINVVVTPTRVDFGAVQVGPSPAPTLQVTFTNAGDTDSTIQVDASATISEFTVGDQAGTFSPLGPVQTLSAKGGSYQVTVAFAPDKVANFSSSFAYTACSSAGPCLAPAAVDLIGLGVTPVVQISPDPITYSGVPAGSSLAQTVTVTNAGSNAAAISCVRLVSQSQAPNQSCGSPSPLFAFGTFSPNGMQATLSVGADGGANALTFPLSYTASGGTSDTDTLAVDYVPQGATVVQTATAPILGNQVLSPCTLSLAPTSLNFGTVVQGTPITRSSTLTNSGQAACTLSGLALGPNTDLSYALIMGTPTTLTIAPGGSAQVGAVFSLNNSNTPNTRTGAIVFTTNDPTQANVSIPLSAMLNAHNPYALGWPKWHLDNKNSGQSSADTSGNSGAVRWKYSGLLSAQTLAATGNSGGYNTINGGGLFTYLNSPIVVDSLANDGTYNVYQVGLDGTLFAFTEDGGVAWKTALSDPSNDPHPSTPAALKDGNLWAISGSDGSHKSGTTQPNSLFLVNPQGGIPFQEKYGEDGFDACPGLGPDGTLFEADDDGEVGKSTSTDPFSAVTFQEGANGMVTPLAGVSFPLTLESERFGVAIADDETSFWGNNGQFFAVSPPASGFSLLSGWPASGVTIANNTKDPNATGPVYSDLALDTTITNFVYAYSGWEDGVGKNGGYYGVGNKKGQYGTTTGPYQVQGVVEALRIADGSVAWTFQLPVAKLPAGWTPLGSDYGNAAPAVATDGTVYVGNGDGLRAIDGPSGALKWLFSSADVTSAPAIGGDGTIFFGCADGTFYAVTASGAQRFSLNAGAPISTAPAIADDGTVFFVSDDGVLWAVR